MCAELLSVCAGERQSSRRRCHRDGNARPERNGLLTCGPEPNQLRGAHRLPHLLSNDLTLTDTNGFHDRFGHADGHGQPDGHSSLGCLPEHTGKPAGSARGCVGLPVMGGPQGG